MENALRSVTIARRLRKTMTLSEIALWTALRGKRLEGLRFRRQHPLGPYVVDFYCAAHRLAVEVDGAVHLSEAGAERDSARDLWISRQGVRVVRIPGELVLGDVDAALRIISEAVGVLR